MIQMRSKSQAILLIHGIWGAESELAYTSKYLSSNELAVYTPVFKTFGVEFNERRAPNFKIWIEEIHQTYLDLKQHYEIVHIGGLSLGGALALALDIHFPGVINGGILSLAPVLSLDGWAMPFYAKYALPVVCLIKHFHNYPYIEHEPYGLKNLQMRALSKKQFETGNKSVTGGNNVPYIFLNEALKAGRYVKRNITEVKAPTLVIHSIEDETASIKNARFIAEKIKSPLFQKVELSNSYHIITWDNERKEVVRYMKNFINTVNSQ